MTTFLKILYDGPEAAKVYENTVTGSIFRSAYRQAWKWSGNGAGGEAAGHCLTAGSAVPCFGWHRPFSGDSGPQLSGFLLSVVVIWRSRIFHRDPIPMKDFNESWKCFIASVLRNLSQYTLVLSIPSDLQELCFSEASGVRQMPEWS